MSVEVEQTRGRRKTRLGKVVSQSANKTVMVSIERLVKHSLYGRRYRVSTKYMAHDEANECRVGDTVLIAETRPLSKRKRWRVVSIVERAK